MTLIRLAVLVGSLVVAGCGTTARYYQAETRIVRTPCFRLPSVDSYPWAEVRRDDLELAFTRMNGSFAGQHGIYRWLFDPGWPPPGGGECPEGDRPADQAAHITAFTQPVPPGPGAERSASHRGMVQTVDLVISSYLYTLRPADRFDKVYTLVTPLEPGVEFLDARGARATELVELGTVRRTTEAEVKPGIPLGTTGGQAVSLGLKATRALERKIARQYAIQNVEIFPLRNILLVSEDGGPAQADIGGNSVTQITFRIPPSLCRRYVRVLGPREGGSVLVCHVESVPALLAAVAVVRSVVGVGASSVDEDDDVVEWRAFKGTALVDLWPAPPLYGVELGPAGVPVAVMARWPGGVRQRAVFERERDALDLAWRFGEFLAGGGSDAFTWGAHGEVTIELPAGIIAASVRPETLRLCRVATANPEADALRAAAAIPPPRDRCRSGPEGAREP